MGYHSDWRRMERVDGRRVRCKDCGAEFNEGTWRNHRARPSCVAKQNEHMAVREGFARAGAFVRKVCEAAGIEVRKLQTDTTREAKKLVLAWEIWCPKWAGNLLFGMEFRHNTEIPEMEYLRRLSELMREANDSQGKRAALESVRELSGVDGLRGMVVTAEAKAAQIRAQALDLEAQARLLHEKANALAVDDDRGPMRIFIMGGGSWSSCRHIAMEIQEALRSAKLAATWETKWSTTSSTTQASDVSSSERLDHARHIERMGADHAPILIYTK